MQATASASVQFTTLGTFILDEFEYRDGEGNMLAAPGGHPKTQVRQGRLSAGGVVLR